MARDYEPTPAIVRNYSDPDRGAEVIHTPYDSVSFTRGFGDSGRRIQVVEYDCPSCDFDRMIRQWRVSPECRDTVKYWCLQPNCGHFVDDHLSHACHGNYPQRKVTDPEVTEL